MCRSVYFVLFVHVSPKSLHFVINEKLMPRMASDTTNAARQRADQLPSSPACAWHSDTRQHAVCEISCLLSFLARERLRGVGWGRGRGWEEQRFSGRAPQKWFDTVSHFGRPKLSI